MAKKAPSTSDTRAGLMKQLKVKEEPTFVDFDSNLKRIVLPAGMTTKTAHKVLDQYEEEQSATVAVDYHIQCYPTDGAQALQEVLRELYGSFTLHSTGGWWGKEPPHIIAIELEDGTTVEAPWGRFTIPGVSGEFRMYAGVDGLIPELIISGEVSRRDSKLVTALFSLVRDRMSTMSIYKGRALTVDLSWALGQTSFDLVRHMPKWLGAQLVADEDLILDPAVMDQITMAILGKIRYTDQLIAAGANTRAGLLLHGGYGVGKTLTMRWLARIATENGWTFIHVPHASMFMPAMYLARILQPAVVAVEDIDTILNVNKRNEDVNHVLNVVDGITSARVIAVATTNSASSIHPAALRSGRLGTQVHLKAFEDPSTIERFLRRYAGVSTDKDISDTVAFVATNPMTGAELADLTQAAQSLALATSNTLEVTPELLNRAAKAIRHQLDSRVQFTPDKDPMQDFFEHWMDGVTEAVSDALAR